MVNIGRIMAGVCVVVLAAAPAFAKEGRGGDPQKHLDRLTKKLELNESQRGQVEQIMNDYRSRIESLRGQIEALQKEKRERINAVLSPEQQEKYQKMKSHKGRRGWFGKRAKEG